MRMNISVVIPVYNVAEFVKEAVDSALGQPETAEILLVEDGSSDGSLDMCRRLERQDSRVRVLRHPNGENRGAGASRNLGIARSVYPYIAFLDADDFYLPGRFRKDAEVFGEHPDADGVYDATGLFFQEEALDTELFRDPKKRMHTVRRHLPPEEYFSALVGGGGIGAFCTDGIVLRREILERTGGFEPELKMTQDTHLWVRVAAIGRLYPGEIRQPVSMARVHRRNRVTHVLTPERRKYQYLTWRRLVGWGRRRRLGADKMRLLVDRYIRHVNNLVADKGPLVHGCYWASTILFLLFVWPSALRRRQAWDTFRHSSASCISRMVGRSPFGRRILGILRKRLGLSAPAECGRPRA